MKKRGAFAPRFLKSVARFRTEGIANRIGGAGGKAVSYFDLLRLAAELTAMVVTVANIATNAVIFTAGIFLLFQTSSFLSETNRFAFSISVISFFMKAVKKCHSL